MRWLNLLLLFPLLGLAAGEADARKSTIVFLCPYGGAKSVIAAAYFNRLAAEQSLPFTGVAAAVEEPYPAVPPRVAEMLEGDGFVVRDFKPRRVEGRDLEGAAKVVSIDCDLTRLDLSGLSVERWDDVPKVSEDPEGSVAAIRRHVAALAGALQQ